MPVPAVCLLWTFPVYCSRVTEQTRRHKSFIAASVTSVASVNNEPEPTCRKRLANSCPLTVALLCSPVTRNVQQLSLRPACAWLTDMAVPLSNNWRVVFSCRKPRGIVLDWIWEEAVD